MQSMSDVVWTRPARDSRDSLPIGNGHWGGNVWVEQDGRIGILVGANDSWSGNGRLLKVARILLQVDAEIDLRDQLVKLSWSLDLQTATVTVAVDSAGVRWRASVWIDAHHDVLVAEIAAPESVPVYAWSKPWRTEQRSVTDEFELESFTGQDLAFGAVVVEPDHVYPIGDSIASIHKNGPSIVPKTVAHQSLDGASDIDDPLSNRVSGVLIALAGSSSRTESRGGALRLCSVGEEVRHCTVALVTEQCGNAEAWQRSSFAILDRWNSLERTVARRRHEGWWSDYWARSFVRATGSVDAASADTAYRRHQYLVAIGGAGPFPIKFNGSVFTMSGSDDKHTWDPDYRFWGGPYWFQNTRLIYWGLLAMGSFESIRPFADLYLRTLPVHRERCRRYWNHAGACFPETMTPWGSFRPNDYGLRREGLPANHIANPYVRHYWQGALELSSFLIDWYSYARDNDVHDQYLLPILRDVLRFYESHYAERGTGGTVLLSPAASLETWHTAVNPTPELAGVRFVADRLELTRAGDSQLREGWRAMANALPEIPLRKDTWRKTERVMPAYEYNNKANSENPELYAVFPYRVYGLGKPNLETGRFTYQMREEREAFGWKQDQLHAALLGLTDESIDRMRLHLSCTNTQNRYPGFWGPNYNWVPDMDHSSVFALALQRMLLQADESHLELLPSWSNKWDVHFRLFAPGGRTVELCYEAGEVTYRQVEHK